jgi:hypothetical protein
MLPLLTLTTFLAAFLLFLVQPMVARMALPGLGGSPAVWNTAMVVFQSLLLAGYAWAHWLASWRGSLRRWAVVAQCGLVLLAMLALPVGLPGWEPPREGSPVLWLVGALLLGVGAPFVALASVSPTLQRWLAGAGHPSGRDPYFLYAASNAGSLLALMGYPLVIEPLLDLRAQSLVFSAVYVAAIAGVVGSAVVTWRGGRGAGVIDEGAVAGKRVEGRVETARPTSVAPGASPAARDNRGRSTEVAEPTPVARPWWWLFLSFTPSALMLGVTLHISTDLAAVPLLWVAPLAIYLLTFIIAFSRRPLPGRLVSHAAGLLGVCVVLTFLLRATEPVAIIAALHLGLLFFGALVCHQRLAHLRPSPERLTAFYLAIATGGALGGAFASLLAPVVFTSVAEYPIAIVLALAAREGLRRSGSDQAHASLARALAVSAAFSVGLGALAGLGARLGGPAWLGLAIGAGLPAVLLYLAVRSPRTFAFGAAGLLAAQTLLPEPDSRTVLARRTFFGVHRVLVGADPAREGGSLVRLRHGATPHGMQRVDARGEPDPTPLLYYHPRGPLGQLFAELGARADGRAKRVGLIGLGVGAAAAYAPDDARWTFYEIDPEVVRIARDSGWFSHVGDGWRWDGGGNRRDEEHRRRRADVGGAGGAELDARFDFIIGDGRLEIARAAEGEFGMIVLDAFSSDAIPTHLLTREAFELYRSRLARGGLIVVHISNRRLDLAPVIAGAAEDLGMGAVIQDDVLDDPADGKWASTWVVLAETAESLDLLRAKALWRPLEANGARAWTDEYADILRVMQWW